MKLNLKFTLLFAFGFISSMSFSQVQDTLLLAKVLKELKLNANEIHMELVSDKILPFSTDKTFFVISEYKTKEKDDYENYFYEFNAYLIIVDNVNGKILNSYFEPNAWTSDAINIIGINIDTGLYNLNEKTRAIGIRVNYSGSSRPNPYNQTDLSLFIPENNKLKKVLESFPISEFYGEWDTNCSGEFTETNSHIDIDKTKNNNFYNLIIKTKTEHTQNIPTKDDCIEKVKTQLHSKKLKFDGKQYK